MSARSVGMLAGVICACALASADAAPPATGPSTRDAELLARVDAARKKGLERLAAQQAKDGSWGTTFKPAVTGIACLSYLSASDEPFEGTYAPVLINGLKYLIAQQKEGDFAPSGHTWIHQQGFATLALSEAYGRALACQTKPDLDLKKLKAMLEQAVKVIVDNQSDSGGWWYTKGSKGSHEGSTTVTAVQAMVSAANYQLATNEASLDRGFEYLKKCQAETGGFNYMLGDGSSMKEGTAADMATLALMRKFDFAVMMNAYKFLLNLGPEAIGKERFPYYGWFYGCMAMGLMGEEFKPFREKTNGYTYAALRELLSWQNADGSWPIKGWLGENKQESEAYATAFATLILSVPEGRLSIYHRDPPKMK